MRDLINIIEGDIIDISNRRAAKTREKVGGLVSGFAAYLERLEEYKSQFGIFQPMLDEYVDRPSEQQKPNFYLEIQYDKIASPGVKKKLAAAGFTAMNDDKNWGTEIHDDHSGYFKHGMYKPVREKNWYTQSSAWKKISKEEAVEIFAHRDSPEIMQRYGRYRTAHPHYEKAHLTGDSTKGWDIRSHPEHEDRYHKSASFWIEMRADYYSQDSLIADQPHMDEALRVYDMIARAEKIRLSGATNVATLR